MLLLPDEPLPPYSYVPGRFPHPIRDPQGHRFAVEQSSVAPPDPDRWRDCQSYLRGIDLFNAGFYWESHESWEAAWHAAGRRGPTADFLKGLIKLAAALVKAREGRPAGVHRHATRAAELLGSVLAAQRGQHRFMGLSLPQLAAWAREVASAPESYVNTSAEPVVKLVSFQLTPC